MRHGGLVETGGNAGAGADPAAPVGVTVRDVDPEREEGDIGEPGLDEVAASPVPKAEAAAGPPGGVVAHDQPLGRGHDAARPRVPVERSDDQPFASAGACT